MSKVLKISAAIIGLVILLFVVSIILLVNLVNPNNFKDQISAAVKKNTGRELTIAGDIKWSFFPWAGLRLNNITLGNASGFGPQAFAKVGEADVNIRLLPLFRDRVEIGTVALKDLTINLEKNAAGKTNWSDLSGDKNTTTTPSTPNPIVAATPINETQQRPTLQSTAAQNPAALAGALLISDVDISNANINWLNQQTGQQATISGLNFKSSDVNFGKAFPVKLQFHLISNKPEINTDITISSNVFVNPNEEKYALQELRVDGKLLDKQFANGELPFSIAANIAANLQQQTVQISDAELNVANLKILTQFNGNEILTHPVFQGNINIPSFNPKAFLSALGKKIYTQDTTALQNISLQSNVQFSPKFVKLSNLNAKLDNTAIQGNLNLSTEKTFNFNLQINHINLDKYNLVPSNPSATASNSNSNHSNQIVAANTPSAALPIALLRPLSGKGVLQIGKLTMKNMTATNIYTQVVADKGTIKIAPFTADLYQGKAQGVITLNSTAVPSLFLNESLSNVQLEPLLNDVSKKSKIKLAGTGNLSINVQTHGINADAMIQALNGAIKFAVNNGVIKNLDISQGIDTALTSVLKLTPNSSDTSGDTPFSSLSGTINIKNGIANNDDLSLKSTALQVTGNGNADLINQSINYQLQAKAIGDPFGKDIFNLQDKIGGSFPLTVKGSFSNPKITPDLVKIATALLKRQGQQLINGKVGQQIEQNLPKNLNNVIKGIGNLLGQ